MPFKFNNPKLFEPGDVYLGVNGTGNDVGITPERHLITVASAGTGKGAGLIIPNLLRWTGSTVTIDPKGENAELTWEAREAMGQTIGIIDPFHVANVPNRLRVSINPLAYIDPNSRTARADVEVVADGLVKRSNSTHAEWDDGAVSILSGVIAYVMTDAPIDKRTLTAVRQVLLQNDKALYEDAQRMTSCVGCGGLAKSAGLKIITALESTKGMEKEFLGGAKRHSEWIDDPAHAAVLNSSTFDLASLKFGNGSLYLVIPPEYLDTQGAFLRLFVRSAINAMAKGGQKGGKCLFLLDEFYSLGRLDIVAKAAGLMRSYGVYLWPFLQNLRQLTSLYGAETADTFISNAHAAMFFGIEQDRAALEYVSAMLGQMTPDEVRPYAPSAPGPAMKFFTGEIDHAQNAAVQSFYQTEINQYQHDMRNVGRPRFTPDEIAKTTGKPNGEKIAKSMIVLTMGGSVYNVRLSPYFSPITPSKPLEKDLVKVASDDWEELIWSIALYIIKWGSLMTLFCVAVVYFVVGWQAVIRNPIEEYLYCVLGLGFGAFIFKIIWFYLEEQAGKKKKG